MVSGAGHPGRAAVRPRPPGTRDGRGRPLRVLRSWPRLPRRLAEASEDAEATGNYRVNETFRVDRRTTVGDARYKDMLVYDREFFEAEGATFEEYPFLLSRRYRAMEQVAEIQGFRRRSGRSRRLRSR